MHERSREADPTRRRRHSRRLAALLAFAFVATPCTLGQKLDLSGTGGIKAGDEKSIDKLAKALRDQARQLETAARSERPHASLVSRTRGRTRQFAAELLTTGASMGEAGSIHVLIGRRIAARLDEFDVLAAACGPEALDAFLTNLPADPKPLPRAPDELDAAIARIFLPLDPGAAHLSAWPIAGIDPVLSGVPAITRAIDQCQKAPGVSVEAIKAMQLYAAGVGGGLTGAAERQLLVQATRIVLAQPRWLPAKTSAALTTLFNGAARRLATPETELSARADLVRIALLADVLGRLDAARLTPRQTRSMRTLGALLADEMSVGGVPAPACDDALAAIRRGMVLFDAYDDARWDDNRRMVREVRPIWREVENDARRARDELVEMIAKITPTAPALSDPAVLGGLDSLRARLDDARRLCVISAWLSGSDEPAVAGPRVFGAPAPKTGESRAEVATKREDRVRRQTGVRLLQLGQRLREEEARDESLAAIRELAAALVAWAPIRGEDDLRAAVAAPESPAGLRWRTLTGGTAEDIARAVTASREAWLARWSGLKERPVKGKPPASEVENVADHIDVLRRLVEVTYDASTVLAMTTTPPDTGIRAWPGFELSTVAMETLIAPVEAELSRAAGAILTGGYDDIDGSLAGMIDHARTLAALAHVEREALARGRTRAPLILELCAPVPVLPTLGEDLTPGVWLLRHRDTLAVLCRCVEEYADSSRAGDRDRALPILKRMAVVSETLASPLAPAPTPANGVPPR